MLSRELDAMRRALLASAEGWADGASLREAAAAVDALQLETALRDAGLRVGVLPAAIPDLLRRGREVFTVDDGRIVPREKRYSRYRPAEQLPVDEWAANDLRTEAPHLFVKRNSV